MGYRQELRELAHDSHGVVTLRDAASVGVPAVEVAGAGRLPDGGSAR